MSLVDPSSKGETIIPITKQRKIIPLVHPHTKEGKIVLLEDPNSEEWKIVPLVDATWARQTHKHVADYQTDWIHVLPLQVKRSNVLLLRQNICDQQNICGP